MAKECKERQAALNLTLDRLMSDTKESIELASESGDISATVKFANWLNTMEEIVLSYTGMYEDEPDLMEC